MDVQVIAAIVGAAATVCAAIIGYLATHRDGHRRAQKEQWYTRWQFGDTPCHEVLELETSASASGVVSGTRTTTSGGEAPKVYKVAGYKKDSFYWLEYHLAEGRGGGAVTLQEFTPGKLIGLVASVDCIMPLMQCRANRWLPYVDRAAYNPEWQSTLGRLSYGVPDNEDRADASAKKESRAG